MSPPVLSARLRPSDSAMSLNSLIGDGSKLEVLGSSSRPLSMAGLSSRCGSGATELIQLGRRAGGDTPPGGPATFETSDKTSRCHAPQMMRSSCLSSSASSSLGSSFNHTRQLAGTVIHSLQLAGTASDASSR